MVVASGEEILPSPIDKLDMCVTHLSYLVEFKSEKLACLEIRNHVGWYLKGLKGAGDIKNKIYQCTQIRDIILILQSYREEILSGKYDESKEGL